MNHGHVKPREFWIDIDDIGFMEAYSYELKNNCNTLHVVEHSAYQAALDEIEKLRTEIEFVKQYLNPKDTSFRQMIDAFKVLPEDKQDKLIALSKSLADLQESEARFPKGEK